MKKLFLLLIASCGLLSCIMNSKPDKRDKYVGEYNLIVNKHWCGERESLHWNYWTRSYDSEFYSDSSVDSVLTLVVRKVQSDTVSLVFDIVKPFDFSYAEEVRKKNDEIKKRNEESICGKDEELEEIPKPSYDDKRDLVKSFNGYVEGHKIFLKDYTAGNMNKYNDGSGYEESVSFDSVYLRNDTMRFILHSHSDFYRNYEKISWRAMEERYIGVKISLE